MFVVGEREFKDNQNNVYTRTFIARYHPFGGLVVPPWTAPGDFLRHEAMNSLAMCGTEIIAGGWTRDAAPGSSPVPLMRWITPDGTSTTGHSELLPSTLACDPEEGFCAGGGFRSSVAFLRVYNP